MRSIYILMIFLLSGFYSFSQPVTFTKVTAGDIVNDGGWNYAMCWADFNQDGYPDLFVANNDGDNGKLNFLYLNNGDGSFQKITEGPVVSDGGSSYCCSVADFNGDAFPDLFVGNYNENNFLYTGNGDGTFIKVTSGPVVSNGGKSAGCAWADYDRDGWIDLYVANRDQANFLYHNLGNGEFEKITTGTITTDVANSSGCAWADFDNDGYPDLYVANSGTVSNLYHNNGDGTFTKVTDEPFSTDVSSCSGASWGDCDNDGDLDLLVATGQLGTYQNWFYKNNGDGTFTKITDSPLVNDATWSSGSAWGDYDSDGDADLAVGGYDGPNLLFENDGFGNFTQVTGNTFVNDASYTEGLAWADADNDGDLDIFTAKNNYFGGNNSFFLNDGNSNNRLKIFLNGSQTNANTMAIGARTYVYATINGNPVMQMHEATSQSGGRQGGQNEAIEFFGLGDASTVDSVIVKYMGNTYKQVNVAANQTLEMMLLISEVTEFTNPRTSALHFYPNPAMDRITIDLRQKMNDNFLVQIADMQGRTILSKSFENPNTGRDHIEIELKDASGKQLTAGIYLIRCIRGNEVLNGKLVIGGTD